MSNKPPTDRFTRFTSTAPASQSSANSAFTAQTPAPSPSQQSSNPETPAEKVARLRAAHRANTTNRLNPVDRLITRGRRFADTAHRVTTYSLLAITGVSTVIAVYGLVSLVSHNRRQKRAWIEREMDRLHDAQQAFLKGTADAEQLHLLEQERAGEEIARRFAEDKKRRKEEGVWGRLKGTFGSFTAKGDMGVETARGGGGSVVSLSDLVEAEGQTGKDKLLRDGWMDQEIKPVVGGSGSGSGIEGVAYDDKGRPVPAGRVAQGDTSTRRAGERAVETRTGIKGGPLDVLADNVVDKAQATGSSWWSWIGGAGGGGGGGSGR